MFSMCCGHCPWTAVLLNMAIVFVECLWPLISLPAREVLLCVCFTEICTSRKEAAILMMKCWNGVAGWGQFCYVQVPGCWEPAGWQRAETLQWAQRAFVESQCSVFGQFVFLGMESKSFWGMCEWGLLYSWKLCCWVFFLLLVFERLWCVMCEYQNTGSSFTFSSGLQKKMWLLLRAKLFTCQQKCINTVCSYLRQNTEKLWPGRRSLLLVFV